MTTEDLDLKKLHKKRRYSILPDFDLLLSEYQLNGYKDGKSFYDKLDKIYGELSHIDDIEETIYKYTEES